MATTLPNLLTTLQESLHSATESIPDISTLISPSEGISLLDTKNELLLSYLQNLIFLIILKLQHVKNVEVDAVEQVPQAEVVKKLVELRVYIEKGVRPLENKLKYQIDKVLRAAENTQRDQTRNIVSHKTPQTNNLSGSESDSASVSDANDEPVQLDALSYRPNPAAFARPSQSKTNSSAQQKHPSNDVYRPPRITPTALPSSSRKPRPRSSRTLSEFVSTEMSTAPAAEPSIGSTIIDRGRRHRSEKEREVDNERRAYEEGNYTRLPKEGKKEQRSKNGRGGERDGGYGGEEWRGLGEGAERIVSLTKGRRQGVLEKGRKREREREEGRGDHSGGGSGAVEKKRKLGPRVRKRKAKGN
ncbi:hypothetical protein MMC14_005213 [Varicellaria rhodocarpa]|nr:hypothetical protein [Varicellaria rhodocarpa]